MIVTKIILMFLLMRIFQFFVPLRFMFETVLIFIMCCPVIISMIVIGIL